MEPTSAARRRSLIRRWPFGRPRTDRASGVPSLQYSTLAFALYVPGTDPVVRRSCRQSFFVYSAAGAQRTETPGCRPPSV